MTDAADALRLEIEQSSLAKDQHQGEAEHKRAVYVLHGNAT